jgi:hypothetical protein
MISEKKKYLIELFLKRCTIQSINKEHINFHFNVLKTTYNISEEKEKELREKYDLNEYAKRLTPILDQFFTEEDLQIAIKFFSSGVGEKMLNGNLLKNIGKISQDMLTEIEQEFSKYNG